MYRVLLSLVLFVFINACDLLDGNETDPALVRPVWAEEIEEVSITDKTVSFTVRCITPNPCHEFHSYETDISGQLVHTRIIAENTAAYCIDILGSIDALVEITLPSSGEYTFSFWTFDDETIDTTLVIQ